MVEHRGWHQTRDIEDGNRYAGRMTERAAACAVRSTSVVVMLMRGTCSIIDSDLHAVILSQDAMVVRRLIVMTSRVLVMRRSAR